MDSSRLHKQGEREEAMAPACSHTQLTPTLHRQSCEQWRYIARLETLGDLTNSWPSTLRRTRHRHVIIPERRPRHSRRRPKLEDGGMASRVDEWQAIYLHSALSAGRLRSLAQHEARRKDICQLQMIRSACTTHDMHTRQLYWKQMTLHRVLGTKQRASHAVLMSMAAMKGRPEARHGLA